MSLADRQYMRDPYNPPRASTVLIVVLIVAFVIQSLLLFYRGLDLTAEFGLSFEGLRSGKVWQLLTYQFLHNTPLPWHVLFNCLGLYFFGRPVEEMLGTGRFLVLYFLAGIFGGLLQAGAAAILPNHYDVQVVGASAGVCGMIAIFCSVHPMQELTTWIYFFPVNVRARSLLIFLTLFSLFGTLVPFLGIAHAAHLGGILLGIAYVRWGEKLLGRISGWAAAERSDAYQLEPAGRRGRPWRGNSRVDKAAPPDEFISREVDPILDKISAHGLHALTEKERQILEAARKRMGRG